MTMPDGQVGFVGKDVAMVLGYSKPLNAIAMHVDKDDSLKWGLTDSLGRTQQTTFINESGLYSLILSSKLPKAREFKHWVTSEVLPQIRKTGGYLNVNENDKLMDSRRHFLSLYGRIERAIERGEEVWVTVRSYKGWGK